MKCEIGEKFATPFKAMFPSERQINIKKIKALKPNITINLWISNIASKCKYSKKSEIFTKIRQFAE